MTRDRHRAHEQGSGTEGADDAQTSRGGGPTTNQPLNAKPRPRVAPAVLVIALLAVVVIVILALTYLGPTI